jgi:hypothetical protein
MRSSESLTTTRCVTARVQRHRALLGLAWVDTALLSFPSRGGQDIDFDDGHGDAFDLGGGDSDDDVDMVWPTPLPNSAMKWPAA